LTLMPLAILIDELFKAGVRQNETPDKQND
jgi:hypothetical protein